jgi:hypothetical protein
MFAITLSSFKEAIRKKIIIIIGSMTILYLVLFCILLNYVFGDLKKMNPGNIGIIENASGIVSILGFYFSSMIVAFVTIMASVGAIASDIESGIINAVISKPIKRMEYVLGKYLGIAVMTVGYSSFLYVFLVVINVVLNIPPLNIITTVDFLKGLALFCFEPLALLSLCIFGSVCWKTMNNGVIIIGVYILGMVGGMMEQIGSVVKLDGLVKWGIVISFFSPFESIYRKMISVIYSSVNIIGSSIAGPFFMSRNTPSIWMMVYALAFWVAFVLLAVRKFNSKDIS